MRERERDALLATKLRIPRSRDVLARPRLLGLLEEAADHELLLVSAPAGFGKSTLLAGWARGGGRALGWLSLDPDDNDPARLWRYLLAALEQLHPGLEERALPLLHDPGRPALEALVTAVVNELAGAPRELTIVLDDYHVIESGAIHQSLALLLERLPPGVHVVIAGRGDPPLPLARMRARGQLAELRAEDLRFTQDEAAALLREVWGLDLPEASVLELGDRTEGWATGLQLAALTLRRGGDPAGLIERFGGGHRYVLDYLTGEVLERQPDEVRRFLLDTSILRRLSGPLCDAVTGRSDGQRMLEELERANLFLVALDEERRWYRYHRLFADLLQLVEAARRAGVGHVVKLSVFDGGAGDDPIGAWTREAEAAVMDSGIDWTMLRPGRFMSNALWWAPMIRADDTVAIPFATRAAAPIDPADVAAVALASLTTEGHRNRAYQLSGPEVLTPADELRLLGEALGRPLRLVEPPADKVRAGMIAGGMPEAVVDAIVARSLSEEGAEAEVLSTVSDILGRPATTFASWAKSHDHLFSE